MSFKYDGERIEVLCEVCYRFVSAVYCDSRTGKRMCQACWLRMLANEDELARADWREHEDARALQLPY